MGPSDVGTGSRSGAGPGIDVALAGIPTRLTATDRDFVDALGGWLRPPLHGVDEFVAPEITVDLRPGPAPDPPPGAPVLAGDRARIWYTPAADGTTVSVRTLAGRTGGAIDLDSGTGTVWAGDGSDRHWWAVQVCLRPLVFFAAARHGRHAVHGSAVALRGHDEPEAVVVLGASGDGKSTFAAHLAGLGAPLVSDDMILASAPPLRIWGLGDHSRLVAGSPVDPGPDATPLPDGKLAATPGAPAGRGPHRPGLVVLLGAAVSEPTRLAAGDLMEWILRETYSTPDVAVVTDRLAVLGGLAETPAVALPARPALPSLATVEGWRDQGAR